MAAGGAVGVTAGATVASDGAGASVEGPPRGAVSGGEVVGNVDTVIGGTVVASELAGSVGSVGRATAVVRRAAAADRDGRQAGEQEHGAGGRSHRTRLRTDPSDAVHGGRPA